MKVEVTALYSCGMCIAPADWNPTGIPRPYRLYYILGGDAYYCYSGERTRLLEGHFYLFPSSLPFNVKQDKENRLDHLYFDFMMTPATVSAKPLCCSLDAHPMMPEMLSLLKSGVKRYRYEKENELFPTVVSLLEAFLSLFLECVPNEESIGSDILSAVEYIERNYAEDISVKKIADMVFLDEDYFIRKFKKALGITPYAYIRNLRLAVAKELRYSGVSQKDAAASVGFKYASSYCRAIKGSRQD